MEGAALGRVVRESLSKEVMEVEEVTRKGASRE